MESGTKATDKPPHVPPWASGKQTPSEPTQLMKETEHESACQSESSLLLTGLEHAREWPLAHSETALDSYFY